MTLYPPDIKLLKTLKEAQGIPTYYVVIDENSMQAFQCTSYHHSDVETAINGGQGIPIRLSRADLEISLQYLLENKYITRPAMAPVFQVLRPGWYNRYVRRREIIQAIVTHIVFPSIVALITTLLTLYLVQPKVDNHSGSSSSYSAEGTDEYLGE